MLFVVRVQQDLHWVRPQNAGLLMLFINFSLYLINSEASAHRVGRARAGRRNATRGVVGCPIRWEDTLAAGDWQCVGARRSDKSGEKRR